MASISKSELGIVACQARTRQVNNKEGLEERRVACAPRSYIHNDAKFRKLVTAGGGLANEQLSEGRRSGFASCNSGEPRAGSLALGAGAKWESIPETRSAKLLLARAHTISRLFFLLHIVVGRSMSCRALLFRPVSSRKTARGVCVRRSRARTNMYRVTRARTC